jgi:hypothetical protein
MNDTDAAEAEIRALTAEAVGALRLLSESSGPLRRANVTGLVREAHRTLERVLAHARRLPK